MADAAPVVSSANRLSITAQTVRVMRRRVRLQSPYGLPSTHPAQLLSIYSSIPRTTCPSSRRAHTRLQRRRQPGAARFERIPSAIDRSGMNEHEHGEDDEVQARQGFGQPLVVACQPPAAVEPAEAALDHPGCPHRRKGHTANAHCARCLSLCGLHHAHRREHTERARFVRRRRDDPAPHVVAQPGKPPAAF
jgi:hypothetical protein